MRALRTGALLLAFCLAACGHAHTVTAAKPVVAPTRPLVSVPGPAELPQYPAPELKPGTDVAAAPAPAVSAGQTGTPAATSSEPAVPAAASATGGAVSSGAVAPAAPSTAPAPDAPTAAPTAEYDPDRLVGLSEADATNLLGPPVEKSDAPPSRVWTYRSQTCDVKLFFYPEVGGTTYRTLTYEINDRDPADTTHGGCVGGLVKSHAG